MNKDTFGRNVATVRSARNNSAAYFAKETGIMENRLLDIESGSVSPTLAEVETICACLGLDMGKMVSLTAKAEIVFGDDLPF